MHIDDWIIYSDLSDSYLVATPSPIVPAKPKPRKCQYRELRFAKRHHHLSAVLIFYFPRSITPCRHLLHPLQTSSLLQVSEGSRTRISAQRLGGPENRGRLHRRLSSKALMYDIQCHGCPSCYVTIVAYNCCTIWCNVCPVQRADRLLVS